MHGGRRTRARGSTGSRRRVAIQPQEIVPEVRVSSIDDDGSLGSHTFSHLVNQFSGGSFSTQEQTVALEAFSRFAHETNKRYSFHITSSQSGSGGGSPTETRLVINMVANTNTGNFEVVKIGTAPALPSAVSSIESRLSSNGISLTGTWGNDEERRAVLVSLNRLSDSELSAIRDIRVSRVSRPRSGPGHEDAAAIGAHYQQSDHLIRVFNKGFENGGTLMALGATRADLLPGVAHAVLHEVGHTLAYAQIRQASQRDRQARQDLERAINTMRTNWPQYWTETRNSNGTVDYQWRQVRGVEASERSSYSRDLDAYQDADRDARAANDAFVDMRESQIMANFRRAAARQAPITAYCRNAINAATSLPARTPAANRSAAERSAWEEFFAEAFAVYKWDPDWLRLNRQPIFDFFDRGRHL